MCLVDVAGLLVFLSSVSVICFQELLEQKKLRHQQRQELSKRHSAAAQNRMRIISQLAEENSSEMLRIATSDGVW